MKQKTANELKGLQGHQFDFVVVRRVPPAKGYLVALQFDQPIIGEGYPMGVTAQVVHHPLGIVQWGLTVNHPLLMIKIAQESFEGSDFFQLFDLAWKLELSSLIDLS